ncbi:MAG: hypothetical protein QM756_35135 [Polyangiaceae bacterium]
MMERRAPLLHPLSLIALATWVLNDHVLKHTWPGVVSGKLSDLCGMLLFPLLLHALCEVAHARVTLRGFDERTSDRVLLGCVCISALGFSAVELSVTGDALYRHGLGLLRWPFRATFALLRGEQVPLDHVVQATADPSDLVALPMALVAYRLGRRATGHAGWLARRLGATTAMLLAVLSTSSLAEARERTHDGFYLNMKLTAGVMLLDSTASISNGFRQEIPSSATGVAFPAGAVEVGATLPATGLVLAGRIGLAQVLEPRISTRGESFRLPDFKLQMVSVEAVARLYLNPEKGHHLGAGFGFMGIEREDGHVGEAQRGFCVSVEGGHYFWIGRQWSAGFDVGMLIGRLAGEELGKDTLFMPSLSLAFVLH